MLVIFTSLGNIYLINKIITGGLIMRQLSKMLFLVIIMSTFALQAGVRVSGTVTTESGDPLSYANVTVNSRLDDAPSEPAAEDMF